jgi:predicted transcriptional regulator
MTKLMTETVILKVDPETKSKLESLAKDSDKSKVIRSLILREWDTQNDSIRVPIVGKIGERK